MAQIRVIKKRMTAVKTIQRITKTMQMIATAKFTAAVARTKATKPYTLRISQLVADVAAAAGGGEELEHPLIRGPVEPAGRELLLVITSDRGLCGAYNANVLRRANAHITALRSRNVAFDLETSGKKAVGYFRFLRVPIAPGGRHTIGDKPTYEAVERLAARYIAEFTAGKYDAVRVAYMRFESNARQVPEVLQLLPLIAEGKATAIVMEPKGSWIEAILRLAAVWEIRERVVIIEDVVTSGGSAIKAIEGMNRQYKPPRDKFVNNSMGRLYLG